MDIGSQASDVRTDIGDVPFNDSDTTTKCNDRTRARKRLLLAALIATGGVKHRPEYSAWRFSEINACLAPLILMA